MMIMNSETGIGFSVDQEVYSHSGHKAHYVQLLPGKGHLVRPVYSTYRSEFDEEEEHLGEYVVWNRVYLEPPVEVFHPQISKLKDDRQKLLDEIHSLRKELGSFQKEHKETLSRIEKYSGLNQLEQFLNGGITHLVVSDGPVAILDFRKLPTNNYSSNSIRMLSLFNDGGKRVVWRLSLYQDGSDGKQARECQPCISLDEANEVASGLIMKRLVGFIQDIQNKKSFYYFDEVKRYQAQGHHIPQELIDLILELKRNDVSQKLDNSLKNVQTLRQELMNLKFP